MKEVTYEEWQKNPTPRMMWVWDNDIENKEKRKVVYVLNNDYTYRVLSSADDGYNYETFYGTFKHCAEIEEPKTRRMTNQKLSRWLTHILKVMLTKKLMPIFISENMIMSGKNH